MRIAQTFVVRAPPAVVFDYMADPANLTRWQTSVTRAEPVSEGPPRQGFRVREWTRPPRGRESEQLVEFAEFLRPERLGVHVVEGPYPVDGTWILEPAEQGTRVSFHAEGSLPGLLRLLEPVAGPLLRRQFARYHENLRSQVEALG